MLALTMGDPASISAEITAAAWQKLRETGPAFAILADPDWIAPHAPIQIITSPNEAKFASTLPVIPVKLAHPAIPGQPNAANAPAIIASIERAVHLAQTGQASAVVTNPIAKSVLMAAGFPHPGHTEFLAALTGAIGRETMMLACPQLRVVPVTIHVSLQNALNNLTTAAIVHAAQTTHAALREYFAVSEPRLAIAGLNPHAGEQGRMGSEETTIIQPAIDQLRAAGMNVTGPHPPDTMFTETARARYDAAICMYHDQALIPLKTIDMNGGVNVTLGLPIIRTSPDHGTAFDIAGKGLADPSSLIAALQMGVRDLQGAGTKLSKAFFFAKKKQKALAPPLHQHPAWLRKRRLAEPAQIAMQAREQKFFGPFLQKRTASLLLPAHSTPRRLRTNPEPQDAAPRRKHRPRSNPA